jgi:phosphotriesterase-related protein
MLVREGFLDRILLSGDVCQKTHLHAYGGKGYDHVQVRFLPLLRQHGVSEEEIYTMTVLNPARLLDVNFRPDEERSDGLDGVRERVAGARRQ